MQKRLSDQSISGLYNADLHELGAMASESLAQVCNPQIRTYIIDRNINYTNICTCRCKFCAFHRPNESRGGWVLPYTKIYDKILELQNSGGKQILMQGGLNPHLDFEWHLKLLSDIKSDFPDLHIHAYSPPEICFFAKQTSSSIENVTKRLCDAGLDTIPGGGAEILVDSIRKRVSPAKCSSEQWLEVMRIAHRLGVFSSATMMFGHLESRADRIEHLAKIRQLQDESLSAGKGCFTSFTAWPFQGGNSVLSDHKQLNPADSMEYLRTIAISRVYLDNISSIQSSWVTMGPQIGQLSLLFGCNDLGSVMMEEKVVAAAGTSFSLNEEQMRKIICSAGFTPHRRNYYYQYQEL
jgi:cyclic dehypoxanthinyl futalosine synthase